MQFVRTVGALLSLGLGGMVACSAPPPVPVAAPLEVAPMPKGAVPPSAPVAVAPDAPHRMDAAGKCGKEPRPGMPAPPMSAVPIMADRVTVLFYWATWCGPCQQQFPKYQAMYARLKTKGFDVVGVSVDDEDNGELKKYAKQYGAEFPTGWDRDKSDASCWRVGTMPTTYVLDRRGVVRFVHDGYHDGEAEVIEREVEGLL